MHLSCRSSSIQSETVHGYYSLSLGRHCSCQSKTVTGTPFAMMSLTKRHAENMAFGVAEMWVYYGSGWKCMKPTRFIWSEVTLSDEQVQPQRLKPGL